MWRRMAVPPSSTFITAKIGDCKIVRLFAHDYHTLVLFRRRMALRCTLVRLLLGLYFLLLYSVLLLELLGLLRVALLHLLFLRLAGIVLGHLLVFFFLLLLELLVFLVLLSC